MLNPKPEALLLQSCTMATVEIQGANRDDRDRKLSHRQFLRRGGITCSKYTTDGYQRRLQPEGKRSVPVPEAGISRVKKKQETGLKDTGFAR